MSKSRQKSRLTEGASPHWRLGYQHSVLLIARCRLRVGLLVQCPPGALGRAVGSPWTPRWVRQVRFAVGRRPKPGGWSSHASATPFRGQRRLGSHRKRTKWGEPAFCTLLQHEPTLDLDIPGIPVLFCLLIGEMRLGSLPELALPRAA